MATAKKKRGMTLTLTHSLSMSSNSTRLLPYLVLGGQESVSDMTTLSMLGVTHVLNVSNECKCWFEDQLVYCVLPIRDEPDEVASAHFDKAHEFIDAVRQRHMAGEKVCCMVHCKTGMSRSSTMVLNHMMRAGGLPRLIADFTHRTAMLKTAAGTGVGGDAGEPGSVPAPAPTTGVSRYWDGPDAQLTLCDALAYIRERRPRASPNPGFMQQLLDLEASLHGAISIDVERYKKDRFGDVRTFCIGDIDPLAGYTGGSASAINDDKFLLGSAGAGGGGGATPVTGDAVVVGEGTPTTRLALLTPLPADTPLSPPVTLLDSGVATSITAPVAMDVTAGGFPLPVTAGSGGGGMGEVGGWGGSHGQRPPPTRKAKDVKHRGLDFGFGEGDDDIDVAGGRGGGGVPTSMASPGNDVHMSGTTPHQGHGTTVFDNVTPPADEVHPPSHAPVARLDAALPPVRDRRGSNSSTGLVIVASPSSTLLPPITGRRGSAGSAGMPPLSGGGGWDLRGDGSPAAAGLDHPAAATHTTLPEVQPPRAGRRSSVNANAVHAASSSGAMDAATPPRGDEAGPDSSVVGATPPATAAATTVTSTLTGDALDSLVTTATASPALVATSQSGFSPTHSPAFTASSMARRSGTGRGSRMANGDEADPIGINSRGMVIGASVPSPRTGATVVGSSGGGVMGAPHSTLPHLHVGGTAMRPATRMTGDGNAGVMDTASTPTSMAEAGGWVPGGAWSHRTATESSPSRTTPSPVPSVTGMAGANGSMHAGSGGGAGASPVPSAPGMACPPSSLPATTGAFAFPPAMGSAPSTLDAGSKAPAAPKLSVLGTALLPPSPASSGASPMVVAHSSPVSGMVGSGPSVSTLSKAGRSVAVGGHPGSVPTTMRTGATSATGGSRPR